MTDLKFHKGWQSAPDDLYQYFLDAVLRGDSFAIDNAIRANREQYGSKLDPVGAHVFSQSVGWHCPDLDIYTQYPFEQDLVEYDLEPLRLLAKNRDVPLSEIEDSPDYAGLPDGVKKLSWFLEDVTVGNYIDHDYNKTIIEFNRIQAGLSPLEPTRIQTSPSGNFVQKPIVTGRDLAAYCHTDFPTSDEQWGMVIGKLLRAGVRTNFPEQTRFIGNLMASGLIGQLLWRAWLLSFRYKWANIIPRPEEYAALLTNKPLSQAYSESSPPHPSANQMHEYVAQTIGAGLLLIFDNWHILPSGNSVAYEINLLVGNIGGGRFHAGVHWLSDSEVCRRSAYALGEKITKEIMYGAA